MVNGADRVERHMKQFQRLCILLISAILASIPSHAAEIKRDADLITLTGEIEPGDLANMAKMVFDGQAVGGAQLTLSLNSEGGSFSEGLAIAKLVHDNDIGTIVTKSNRCNSVCALIFLGGSYGEAEESKSEPDRTLEVGAQLGFHAPFPAQGGPPVGEAEFNRLRGLFEKFDVPQAIMPLLLRNDAAHSLFDATTMEAIELLQITIEGSATNPGKLTKSMVVNSCINGHRYALEQLPSAFSAQDRQAFETLNRTHPLVSYAEGENTFILVPALKLATGGEAFCKIDAQGACSGIFNMSALATFSDQDSQISELNQCQRMNVLTPLVPSSTTLAALSSVLAAMQQQEPQVSASLQPVVDLPPGGEEGAEVLQAEQPRPVETRVICNLRKDENQQPMQFANIRQGPSGKTPLVISLPNMARVEVIGQAQNPDTNHLWWKIRSGESVGFVDNELVAENCLIAGPLPTAAPPVKPLVKPGYQPREAVVCNKKGDSANVRNAPNPKASQVISKVFNLERLTIIGEANNPDSGQLYFKVRANGIEGFVDNELVSASCDIGQQQQQAAQSGVMCNPNLNFTNMRAGPNSQQFGVIAELDNNTPVDVLEQTSNPVSGAPWFRIRANGAEGYVDASNVAEVCGGD
jgi:hypothetical protein